MAERKIDGHRHIYCPAAMTAASKIDAEKAASIYPSGIEKMTIEVNQKKGAEWSRKMGNFEENIEDMKGAGIEIGVLQPTQTMFFYWAEASAGAELARMVNEFTAEWVRQKPDEFVGLATLPLQQVELAIKELDHAVKTLGLRGVVTGSNVNGHGFDEERFRPFFERVEELDVPIFIHPSSPGGIRRVRRYYMVNYLALPLETTIAAVQLALGGVLDRYPELKICLSHAGGVLPFLLGRIEHGQSVRPESHQYCEHAFSYYLKNFYLDTITHHPGILRFVLDIIPPGHAFMGTDYPYDMADTNPIGTVEAAVEDVKLRKGVLGGNLSAVLKLP